MSNLRQAAQQALEAWENPLGMKDLCVAMDALRAALAEQCPHGADDGCKECYVAEQELVIDCPRCGHCCPQRKPLMDAKYNELRRLHQVNQELLEALKAAKTIIGHPDDAHTRMIADVINKAERTTT